MSDNRATLWFVEIRDAKTNEAAMEYLSRTCDATPDKFERHKDCAGIPHDVVRVPRHFINLLAAHRRMYGFMYMIYVKHKRDACIRASNLDEIAKIRRTRAFKKAQKEVKEKIQK